jgi:hypothetical protein
VIHTPILREDHGTKAAGRRRGGRHRAARDVVAGWDLGATWSWSRRYKDLREAVAALDAVPLPNPEAGHGRWVEGSPETSRNAALVRPKGTRWAIVLQLSLASREQRGLTDEELERRLKAKHTTVSAARNHLVGVGWVAGLRLPPQRIGWTAGGRVGTDARSDGAGARDGAGG